MNKTRLVLWLVIGICVAYVGFGAVKEGLIRQMSVAEMIDGKLTDESVSVYENSESNYKISIPSNWGIAEGTSDEVFESRVEITPPEGELKVSQISIDVLKSGQEISDLYTDADFAKWEKVEIDTSVDGITKFGDSEIDGVKVLFLADLTNAGDSPTDNDWSMLGWFRKDGRNFYVRMFGKQNIEEEDKQVFSYLIGTMII